jgi:hypothetical protein
MSVEHLHDVKFEKTLTPHEVLPRIKSELGAKSIFSEDFEEVTIIHQNELATLVPNDLFSESHIADYLKYNSKILESDYISFDEVDDIDAKNVYVPYVNINNYIFDTFGQFTYKHSLTVLIEAVCKNNYSNSTDYRIYLNLNPTTFEMLVFHDKKVILTNIHQYVSKEDVLYFVLFTFEQLDLNTEIHELILSGDIEKDDDIYHLLYKYIRHISFNTSAVSSSNMKTAQHSQSRHYLILNSL